MQKHPRGFLARKQFEKTLDHHIKEEYGEEEEEEEEEEEQLDQQDQPEDQQQDQQEVVAAVKEEQAKEAGKEEKRIKFKPLKYSINEVTGSIDTSDKTMEGYKKFIAETFSYIQKYINHPAFLAKLGKMGDEDKKNLYITINRGNNYGSSTVISSKISYIREIENYQNDGKILIYIWLYLLTQFFPNGFICNTKATKAIQKHTTFINDTVQELRKDDNTLTSHTDLIESHNEALMNGGNSRLNISIKIRNDDFGTPHPRFGPGKYKIDNNNLEIKWDDNPTKITNSSPKSLDIYTLMGMNNIFKHDVNNNDIANQIKNLNNDDYVVTIGFGQSGAGKTFTLFGPKGSRETTTGGGEKNGVLIEQLKEYNASTIKLSIVEIFEKTSDDYINLRDVVKHSEKVSYRYIKKAGITKSLKNQEINKIDKYGANPQNAEWVTFSGNSEKGWWLKDGDKILLNDYLLEGLEQRTFATTTNNVESSRSHVIIELKITNSNNTTEKTMFVIDAAGVENDFDCTGPGSDIYYEKWLKKLKAVSKKENGTDKEGYMHEKYPNFRSAFIKDVPENIKYKIKEGKLDPFSKINNDDAEDMGIQCKTGPANNFNEIEVFKHNKSQRETLKKKITNMIINIFKWPSQDNDNPINKYFENNKYKLEKGIVNSYGVKFGLENDTTKISTTKRADMKRNWSGWEEMIDKINILNNNHGYFTLNNELSINDMPIDHKTAKQWLKKRETKLEDYKYLKMMLKPWNMYPVIKTNKRKGNGRKNYQFFANAYYTCDKDICNTLSLIKPEARVWKSFVKLIELLNEDLDGLKINFKNENINTYVSNGFNKWNLKSGRINNNEEIDKIFNYNKMPQVSSLVNSPKSLISKTYWWGWYLNGFDFDTFHKFLWEDNNDGFLIIEPPIPTPEECGEIAKKMNIELCEKARKPEGFILINPSLKDFKNDTKKIVNSKDDYLYNDYIPPKWNDKKYENQVNMVAIDNTNEEKNLHLHYKSLLDWNRVDKKPKNEYGIIMSILWKMDNTYNNVDNTYNNVDKTDFYGKLNFNIINVINTSTIDVHGSKLPVNNPPKPPYVNIYKLQNTIDFGTKTLVEFKNNVNKCLIYIYNYEFYEENEILKKLFNLLNNGNPNIINKYDSLLYLISELIKNIRINNASTLIGTLETMNEIKNISNNKLMYIISDNKKLIYKLLDENVESDELGKIIGQKDDKDKLIEEKENRVFQLEILKKQIEEKGEELEKDKEIAKEKGFRLKKEIKQKHLKQWKKEKAEKEKIITDLKNKVQLISGKENENIQKNIYTNKSINNWVEWRKKKNVALEKKKEAEKIRKEELIREKKKREEQEKNEKREEQDAKKKRENDLKIKQENKEKIRKKRIDDNIAMKKKRLATLQINYKNSGSKDEKLLKRVEDEEDAIQDLIESKNKVGGKKQKKRKTKRKPKRKPKRKTKKK